MCLLLKWNLKGYQCNWYPLKNWKCKKKLFVDKTYDKQDMIKYCDDLIDNPPTIKKIKEKVKIRDWYNNVSIIKI